jgi:copper chaperone CopZ
MKTQSNQKIMKYTSFLVILFMLSAHSLSAQTKKTDTVQINSSVVCQMCKDRIENSLAYEKGIKDVSVDLETKKITVKFNTKSTSVEEIRKKISKLGYDADLVLADPDAYAKLPACCKKDAPKH